MPVPLDVLKDAKAYLAERKLTQGAFARDALGKPADPRFGGIESCCTAGACIAIQYSFPSKLVGQVYRSLATKIQPEMVERSTSNDKLIRIITNWNDTQGRTKTQVLELFDAVIKEQENAI